MPILVAIAGAGKWFMWAAGAVSAKGAVVGTSKWLLWALLL